MIPAAGTSSYDARYHDVMATKWIEVPSVWLARRRR